MEENIQYKKCSKCNGLKPLSEFNKCKKSKDKLTYRCRDCERARLKLVYKKNKEKYKEKHIVYYKNNKEKIYKKSRLWLKNNEEKMKEYFKIYYENNVEKMKEYQNKYHKKHNINLKKQKKSRTNDIKIKTR